MEKPTRAVPHPPNRCSAYGVAEMDVVLLAGDLRLRLNEAVYARLHARIAAEIEEQGIRNEGDQRLAAAVLTDRVQVAVGQIAGDGGRVAEIDRDVRGVAIHHQRREDIGEDVAFFSAALELGIVGGADIDLDGGLDDPLGLAGCRLLRLKVSFKLRPDVGDLRIAAQVRQQAAILRGGRTGGQQQPGLCGKRQNAGGDQPMTPGDGRHSARLNAGFYSARLNAGFYSARLNAGDAKGRGAGGFRLRHRLRYTSRNSRRRRKCGLWSFAPCSAAG
jgi:hypothetical protein